ncbi:Putative VHS domain, GAT domain, clathrin adaptor, appendage, Ig-like subdomain superfamily [Septoria linicola]|uniref:VHS domain, GAT domain, clathrin adaptor, appendage, Ig-like subdomain superfamily n=1 Tax=Septoria linicola TaxID=215465 RepID=A0A9Q9B294_9PEZI|nr:putative VHS domain, GAT domain, clathrin adaptor, appendage, Ig-like subdomain superfamily [Septoria linicola]USW59330.1 Putative VHS domain, GAT domain, clathrin adaptor, appendage, Ig-like subdomain superfamily [Septoria linicola]
MEAASARYAARDRFAYPTEPAATPLQRYIQQACSPENFEPNLALCLEIADLVNAKKGGAPREAAVDICKYINHRNPNVSLLALSLLDICVKNCGYPFHLQISTKEFLNELVRRFPERPPIRTTRVQNRILELIEEWRRTICETSKYKEDLGFIRDMHRLLHYKGYQFPQISREDAAVLNPSDNLKSVEEMEAEEQAAQSAKLQELIRRGTPHDLQEANKLMKVMAGYDTRHKTDYRAKAAEEVGRIQQKAKLLEEMMQGVNPGEKVQEGDVFEELANALASAHPKIQKMCEQESDDHEAVAKLFEINDSIHRTIERYKLIKKGDVEGANAIPKGTLGVSGAGVKQGGGGELSLIDFGGADDAAPAEQSAQPQPSTTPAAPKQVGNALEDDLLGLNMGDGNYGPGGGISLGGASNGNVDIMAQFNQPQASNSIFNTQPKASPAQAAPAQAQQSSFNLFSSFPSSSQPPSKSATPIPASLQQHQPKKSDPFAALATPPRQASPFQHAPSKAPAPSSTGLDLLGMDSSNGASAPAAAASAHDDEWEFSSALPDQPTEITVTSSSVKTVFAVSRSSDSELLIQSRISNATAQPVADLTFQLAVTKGLSLKLEPQSGRNLAPNQQNGITQTIRLQGAERGKGTSVKMRWRASYSVAGKQQNEQGEINGLGVP